MRIDLSRIQLLHAEEDLARDNASVGVLER